MTNLQSEKKYNIFGICLVGGLWLLLSLACFFTPSKASSSAERRTLAQFPKLTTTSLRSGGFMTNFEVYSLDQFPGRDSFRSIKAVACLYLFHQNDNNGLYIENGYVEKMSDSLSESSINHAIKILNAVYENNIAGTDAKLYLSLIPDKGYFMAEDTGHLSLNYEQLFEMMQNGLPYAKYIDIVPHLSLSSYYKTDTHWRQEQLLPVADTLLNRLFENNHGSYQSDLYELRNATDSFHGVYTGQIALPLSAESIQYYTNGILESCNVVNIERPSVSTVYEFERLESKDPYEMFLSGAAALITIENANCNNDRELVVFRDSYGSSLVPLLVSSYHKITLVDLRYLNSSFLSSYVTFDQQDVLFLYSTLLINSSFTMK